MSAKNETNYSEVLNPPPKRERRFEIPLDRERIAVLYVPATTAAEDWLNVIRWMSYHGKVFFGEPVAPGVDPHRITPHQAERYLGGLPPRTQK